MSDRTPHLYEAAAHDAAELQRAARICLLGTEPPDKTDPGAPSFADWAVDIFPAVHVPHLLAVRQAAAAGDLAAVLLADAAFPPSLTDAAAGTAWLAARTGTRHEGITRRFAAAAVSGKSPGNFHTVLALQAALYHIPLLPLFQTALYCEWRRRLSAAAPRNIDTFLLRAGTQLATLTALLRQHAPVALTVHRRASSR